MAQFLDSQGLKILWKKIKEKIPINISDLNNDAEFVTIDSVPKKISDLTNDSGFITINSVPKKTSQLTNDSNFITENQVNNKISGIIINNPNIADKAVSINKLDQGVQDKLASFITENDVNNKISNISINNQNIVDKAISFNKLDDDLRNRLSSSSGGGSFKYECGEITKNNVCWYNDNHYMTGKYHLIGDNSNNSCTCILSINVQFINGWKDIYYTLPVAAIGDAKVYAVSEDQKSLRCIIESRDNRSVMHFTSISQELFTETNSSFILVYQCDGIVL